MRENLHFVVVGHVDHGKSTLIGRLLYDTNSLPPDKMEEVRKMGKEYQGQPEFAFVMDHLEEERNQRITIDTAQIFFKTARRDYVIIDAPGHKQFLKNMITGATQAEAALLLIDAEEGLREQTHRHAYMLGLLGLHQIVVIINKMDLVDYDQTRFNELSGKITTRLAQFGIQPLYVIPIAARLGDNVAVRNEKLSWYAGPTLLEVLDQLQCRRSVEGGMLRFPVQDVYQHEGESILVGRVASGTIKPGQTLRFVPAGQTARVVKVKTFGHDLPEATAGLSIGITIDSSDPTILRRGQIACTADHLPQVTSRFDATVFWMCPRPLQLGEKLDLKCATQQVPCTVTKIADRMNSSSLEILQPAAQELQDTEVARLSLQTDAPIALDPHQAVSETGQFVLMKYSDTVAGGLYRTL